MNMGSGDEANHPRRPNILKPVMPPQRRDGSQYSGNEEGYTSTGVGSIFNAGYLSQGGGQSDGESVRLSNVNSYKYNGGFKKNLMNGTARIQKINPIQ